MSRSGPDWLLQLLGMYSRSVRGIAARDAAAPKAQTRVRLVAFAPSVLTPVSPEQAVSPADSLVPDSAPTAAVPVDKPIASMNSQAPELSPLAGRKAVNS